MSGSGLRTYVLTAVVSVLLGTGIGFGWYFLVDRAGGRAVASTVITPAKQEAPNPPASKAQRESPVPDVPSSSDAPQSARSTAFDLSNDEKLALVDLLTRSIANDRYPSSPRVRTLQSILVRIARNLQRSPRQRRRCLRHRTRSVAAAAGNSAQTHPFLIADEIRARR